MKRYISVLQMIIRSSIYKVLSVLAIMIAVESILLMYAWNQPIASLEPSLEEWVERSWICVPFLLAYWLVTKVLASSGTNVGSVQSYTLQRLRISENKVYLLQCIYNIFAYVLLWVTQVLMLFGVSAFYMKFKTGTILTNQTVFLAFYRNKFMHSVLPMEDIFGNFILIFYIVGTGILAAYFARCQRNGKMAWSLILFVALAVFVFLRNLGDEPIVMSMISLMWGTYILSQALFKKGVQTDEKEQ